MIPSLEELLSGGASALGVSLDERQVKLFFKYMDFLLEWSKKFNLTAIKEPQEVIVKHFLDSLSLVAYLQERNNIRLLDIGAGAGFPGVPIKLASPGISVVLLESLNKRVNFLHKLIAELGIEGITAIHGRAEDLGQKKEYRENFDIVVSRAVAEMPVLAELCLPFARLGGLFVAYKGPKVSEEILDSESALKILGGKLSKQVEITLPYNEDRRTLVFIEKSSPTPEKYPRKPGIPEKRPIKNKAAGHCIS